MATAQKNVAPEQRIVLNDVSWETYESLLADYADRRVPRFTYDRGVLEIVSPTTRHERTVYALTTIVTIVAAEQSLDADGVGSMTFKRRDLQQGFEPDASFYLQHARHVSDTRQIDLAVDPPPDLVIEIDVTNLSLDKLPIYAQIGVPEVWRYEEATDRVNILLLQTKTYRSAADSGALPPLSDDVLTRFVRLSRSMKSSEWLRELQRWIREASGKQG